jgi:flagellar biosynthetic protein FlhB
MADSSQKTEQPTLRRLKKAREEGNFPSARLFVNAMQFLTFVALLHAWGPAWIGKIRMSMASLFEHSLSARMNQSEIVRLSLDFLWATLVPLASLGGVLIILTLAVQMGVSRLGLSMKKLAPDLTRLNPISKLRELPKQNLPAMLQAMVMIPVFGSTVYFLVKDDFTAYIALPLKSLTAGASQVAGSIEKLLWKAAFLFLVFGAVDLARQQRRYQQGLKMSKQEIRDESKEVEGNPQMKARIRRLRNDQARRVMMHEVATATAVIVNPTHVAVALRYDMGSPGAPKVVAKGKNYLAQRIRERALSNQIPLIENPPLARALYTHADVGQEIPANFYRAVAEILGYIFRLTNDRPSVQGRP